MVKSLTLLFIYTDAMRMGRIEDGQQRFGKFSFGYIRVQKQMEVRGKCFIIMTGIFSILYTCRSFCDKNLIAAMTTLKNAIKRMSESDYTIIQTKQIIRTLNSIFIPCSETVPVWMKTCLNCTITFDIYANKEFALFNSCFSIALLRNIFFQRLQDCSNTIFMLLSIHLRNKSTSCENLY